MKKLQRIKEKSVHKQFAQYMKMQYPDVTFRTDFAAGSKMTMIQAVQHKELQSDKSYPDVFIAEPRGGYHGLYLELKRDREEVYTKDGRFKVKMVAVYKTIKGIKVRVGQYDHIAEQAKMIDKLNRKGYKALFACGFDHARQTVDEYLKLVA
jgi:hypothetical protein